MRPVVGQRYVMRKPTREERQKMEALEAPMFPCVWCKKGKEPPATWNRLSVECVPLMNPKTFCCGHLDEPPPGSYAIKVLRGGGKRLNGLTWWLYPWTAFLLDGEAHGVGGKCPSDECAVKSRAIIATVKVKL